MTARKLSELVAEWEKLRDAATPGPWVPSFWFGPLDGPDGHRATIFAHGPRHVYKEEENVLALRDSEFIAAARTLPDEIIARQARMIEVLREGLEKIAPEKGQPPECANAARYFEMSCAGRALAKAKSIESGDAPDVPEGICALCGQPMPDGETMFRFHGYSGPCPKPAPEEKESR